jgi:hypothetical protein
MLKQKSFLYVQTELKSRKIIQKGLFFEFLFSFLVDMNVSVGSNTDLKLKGLGFEFRIRQFFYLGNLKLEFSWLMMGYWQL